MQALAAVTTERKQAGGVREVLAGRELRTHESRQC